MKNSHRFVVATLASLMLVAALCAMPPATDNAQPTATAQTPASQLSASGKITAIGKDAYTLTDAGGHTSTTQQPAQEAPKAKSMISQIEKNTTIDGKLKVDANADVTYRKENGKNIAISVHAAA